MCIPSQDLCSHGFLCLEHTPPPTRTHLCHGSTSLLIPVFVQMSCPKTIISNAAFSPTPFTLCCRPFPTIAAINSPHRELESVCPPLNLGWPCDLIWPIEHRGSGNVPVPGLVFSKLGSFQDAFSGEASCHTIKKIKLDYWLMRHRVEGERECMEEHGGTTQMNEVLDLSGQPSASECGQVLDPSGSNQPTEPSPNFWPTESWKIVSPCLKPLNLGMVCYKAIGNWNTS